MYEINRNDYFTRIKRHMLHMVFIALTANINSLTKTLPYRHLYITL